MRTSSLFVVLASLALSVSAQAGNNNKNKFAQNHPRRAEVLKRDRNEQKANNQAAAQGKITQGQANKLNREDANIRRQEQADAKKNGGYITPAEKQGLNREENRVNQQRANMEKRDASGSSGSTFAQQHPARAEVLNRDNREVGKNNAAEATGKITTQQANRLNREDAAIKRQEQRDARQNGGHITAQEDKQLNREENRVNQQRANMEKRDATAAGSAAPAPTTAPTPSPATAAPATGN